MKSTASEWPLTLVIYEAGYHDGQAALFGDVLADFRIRMVRATSQKEVLAAISAQPLDFVLVMGCGAGGIDQTGHVIQEEGKPLRFDGLGLGKLAKKQLPELQGIFTSGYPLSERVLADIDRHGLAFLPKPSTQNELLELILLLLWRHGERATKPDHYFSCGGMKQRVGDLPGALRDLSEAIALNPQDDEALVHRSEVKRRLGDAGGARADSNQASELKTKSSR